MVNIRGGIVNDTFPVDFMLNKDNEVLSKPSTGTPGSPLGSPRLGFIFSAPSFADPPQNFQLQKEEEERRIYHENLRETTRKAFEVQRSRA